jgi:hypothetical protein
MPGISVSKIPIPFRGAGGISWQTYWTTLISATVENAAPTHVVLTFPSEGTSLATDITCTVNGVARAVSSASWTGAVWTVVLASAVEYGDVVVVTFVPSGGTANVTNNVLYYMLIEPIGAGTSVITANLYTINALTLNLIGNARFYSDAAGTLNESTTFHVSANNQGTFYLRPGSGGSRITFSDVTNNITLGFSSPFWVGDANSASLVLRITRIKITGLYVNNAALTIIGDPNNTLRLAVMQNSTWVFSNAFPNTMTYIDMNSNALNWTGLSIGSGLNVTNLNLSNYRINKMSSTDMITLLTQLTNRTGTLPTTITINDYADYASPPAEVVAAVNALKLAKSITTVNLGA